MDAWRVFQPILQKSADYFDMIIYLLGWKLSPVVFYP